MKIRRPRGIPTWQLMVTLGVGFLGGIYIYKPLFIKYRREVSGTEIPASPAIDTSKTT